MQNKGMKKKSMNKKDKKIQRKEQGTLLVEKEKEAANPRTRYLRERELWDPLAQKKPDMLYDQLCGRECERP